MDPKRFDSLAKSLANPISRRRLLQGMAGGIVAGLLGKAPGTTAQPAACPAGQSLCDQACVDMQNDRNHCGVCGTRCGSGQGCVGGQCIRVVCDAGLIDCWGEEIDPTSDELNCGQCGAACATGSFCTDCLCDDADLIDGAGICRSRYVRLWLNAFLPGALAGVASMQTVDGERRAVLRLEWPNPEGDEELELFLLADRDPDDRFTQIPFSADINAPSVGHVVFDLTLPTMVPTTPVIRGGKVVVLQPDGAGGFSTLCERSVKPPTAACFDRQTAASGIAYDVNCRWTVQRGSASNAACPIDQLPIPDIRVQGRLEVDRVDANQWVEVRFLGPGTPPTNGRVSQFPAMEMYASLDDGNKVPIFTFEPATDWISTTLAPVEDELGQQCGEDECQGVVARLGCGCGTSCIDNQECFVGERGVECNWQKSYFVLSGSDTFDPSNDIVCTDPRCPADAGCTDRCAQGYITADGRLEIFVDGRPIYLSDRYGKQIVPPIGFEAERGEEIRITGPDTLNTRNGLAQLYLHRIDGPHGLRETQPKPLAGNAIAVAGEKRVETRIDIGLQRSSRGSTICCRDGDEQVCVDRLSSKRHCGACDRSCPEGMICLGGNCICPHPGVMVGDQCFDLTQSDLKCGPAQENCTLDDRFCAQSACVHANCRDSSNFQVCNGACVSLTEATACGASCEPCHVPMQGQAVCRHDGENGFCDIDCLAGFQRCGNECYDPSDAQHCGPSCLDCGQIPNGASVCLPTADDPTVFGCAVECTPGFRNCSGQCVADSILSCGDACLPCDPWHTYCSFGICCNESSKICESECVDIFSNMNHCGDCGLPCNGECCVGGQCFTMGQSCGPCGTVCSGGQICDSNSVCSDPAKPITCPECMELVGGDCQIMDGYTIIGGVCFPIVVSE